MRIVGAKVRSVALGLSGLGLAVTACSGGARDCRETRTCPVPVGYIDAGSFDDWWSAGAAGEVSTSAEGAATPGTSAEGGDGGAGGAYSALRERPNIVGLSPANGAVGLPRDTRIVMTFDRPVNTTAVEAAYVSADLPRTALTFSWNDAANQLTLIPNRPLSYGGGSAAPDGRAEFAPITYHYGFDAIELDADGQQLPAVRFSFSTLREISLELLADPRRTGNWTDGEGEGIHNCLRQAQPPYTPTVCVGDDSNNVRYTGFISFDLSPLPEQIVEISSAHLLCAVVAHGAPEALGPSLLEHVAFGELDDSASAALAERSLGPFLGGAALSEGARFELVEDVTSAVAIDYQSRAPGASSTQYRLSFAKTVSNGAWDDVELATSSLRLALVYLSP